MCCDLGSVVKRRNFYRPRVKYAELPQRSWRLRTRTASDDEAYVSRSRHHSIELNQAEQSQKCPFCHPPRLPSLWLRNTVSVPYLAQTWESNLGAKARRLAAFRLQSPSWHQPSCSNSSPALYFTFGQIAMVCANKFEAGVLWESTLE